MYRQVFAGAVALMAATAAQAQTDLVARGKYLVEAIGGCNDCHSPMDQTGKVIPGRALMGAPLMFAPTVPIPWAPVAPPIAGGPAGYTDAQLVSFLQTGVRPDGSMAKPPMPAFRLNAEDARAMTAYLKSLRPG
jgi:mono/diheme cytochrome c family protein